MGKFSRAIKKGANKVISNKILRNTISGIGNMALGAGRGALSEIIGGGKYRIKQFNRRSNRSNNISRGTSRRADYNRKATGLLSFKQDVYPITHREYIGDVISSSVAGAFSIQTFQVQPADVDTFPWLSGFAQNFARFKVKSLVFEFVSNSGTAVGSTNTALGAIVGAVMYDVTNTAPTTKAQLMNIENAVSERPDHSFMVPMECKGLNYEKYFVRLSDTQTDVNQQLYNPAEFYIASQGLQGTNVNMGALYVSYVIDFSNPVLPQVDGDYIRFTESTGTTDSTAPFVGMTEVDAVSDLYQVTLDSTNSIINFGALATGNYIVNYGSTGGTGVNIGALTNTLVGCTISGTTTTTSGNAVNNLQYRTVVTITAINATMVLKWASGPLNYTSSFIEIFKIA